jgi:hypothetical protein
VDLNNCPDLDIQQSLLDLFGNDNDNPYSLVNIDALLYDQSSFINRFTNDNKPLFCNLNIQSLNSKHDSLSTFINELAIKNIKPDVFCLQEIWQVIDESAIAIPDYNFVFKKRAKYRGGGVGCYIKKGINFKILERHTVFIEKIFESLVLEIFINGKKLFYVTSIDHPLLTHVIHRVNSWTVFLKIFHCY